MICLSISTACKLAMCTVRSGVVISLSLISSLSPAMNLPTLISSVSWGSQSTYNLSHSFLYSSTDFVPCFMAFSSMYCCCLYEVGTYFLFMCFLSLVQELILPLSSLILRFWSPSNHIAADLINLILASLYCWSGGVFLNSK